MIKRPMKGDSVEDLSQIRLPAYAFRKIDGFRCVLAHRPLTSRLSPFPNIHFDKELSDLPLLGNMLDSEATVGDKRGKGVLGRTSSGLTSKDGKPDFHLWCFDTPSYAEREFDERLDITEQLIEKLGHPRVHFLRPKLIHNLADLQAYVDKSLKLGYEGIITRSRDGRYKFGKSTLREQGMLKVKPFDTFEAVITGYFEEMENTNEARREATGKLKRSSSKEGKVPKGSLGGFIGNLVDSKGKVIPNKAPVRVGGGFTARQRKDFWAIRDELVASGSVMRCSKQLMGEKDSPRHPNFEDLRPRWDMS
jgi:DNA ligase-1